MAQAFDGIASDVEQLRERVRELEQRVSVLEGQPASAAASPPSTLAPSAPGPATSAPSAPAAAMPGSFALRRPRAPETWRGFPAPNVSFGALPVFGKAVLAIAGAYLLRAVAESGMLPKLPLLVVAILYAGMWLVWAARTHAVSPFASVTYAITAALILSPLLWESTVRFQILWPVFTAAVLAGFVALALALAWRQNLQAIPWIAILAAVVTALALFVATRELVAFTVGLLTVALAVELVVCLGHGLSVRVVPAIAADLAVWLLVYLMTSGEGVPPEYRPIGGATITVLCLTPLAIYGGSIGLRSFGLRHRLTIFEIAQGIMVLGLAAVGTLRARPGSAAALGVFFLLVAAVCYWGALSRFMGDEHHRNRRVCATYAAALVLTGSFLLLPADLQATFLSLAAVAGAFLYMGTGKLSLGMHVSVYLLAAAILSGLLNLAGGALAGTVPSTVGPGAWVVAVSAVVCYGVGLRASADQRIDRQQVDRQQADEWKARLLWVVPCVLLAGAGAALAVMASVRLGSAGGMLNASRLSVVRTVVICAVALLLGFSGSRLKRAELLWVAYVAIAFGTLKLVFEDLRFGNAASLVASLLCYGLILILIPRLARLGRDRS
jgi:hypothetical protein